jgi:hypothetical protein
MRTILACLSLTFALSVLAVPASAKGYLKGVFIGGPSVITPVITVISAPRQGASSATTRCRPPARTAAP